LTRKTELPLSFQPCCLATSRDLFFKSALGNFFELDALQGFKQVVLKHHERFTDKTLNHIVYIDKKLWDSPDDAFKQKILSDAEKNKNKVIVVECFVGKALVVFENILLKFL
jgi:hypothetical protein